jgi:hypothetical protein
MSWKARIGLIAFGLIMFFVASSHIQAGKFVFENGSYRETTFAWSGYGVGTVFILLAFLLSWAGQTNASPNRTQSTGVGRGGESRLPADGSFC